MLVAPFGDNNAESDLINGKDNKCVSWLFELNVVNVLFCVAVGVVGVKGKLLKLFAPDVLASLLLGLFNAVIVLDVLVKFMLEEISPLLLFNCCCLSSFMIVFVLVLVVVLFTNILFTLLFTLLLSLAFDSF